MVKQLQQKISKLLNQNNSAQVSHRGRAKLNSVTIQLHSRTQHNFLHSARHPNLQVIFLHCKMCNSCNSSCCGCCASPSFMCGGCMPWVGSVCGPRSFCGSGSGCRASSCYQCCSPCNTGCGGGCCCVPSGCGCTGCVGGGNCGSDGGNRGTW